jgi:putative flavoprotein involved in K+ transport
MSRLTSELDAVIVGGGQAGLATAYYLQQAGVRFVVVERGEVGETWRSQRWDSFTVNTPNWANMLPGDSPEGVAADAFFTRDELVEAFDAYARRWSLPIRQHTEVTAVERGENGERLRVAVTSSDGAREVLECRAVVVASGILQTPKIPSAADQLPSDVTQLHAAQYRNPDDLPEGAVLVVGGGQSGCQIAEDLLAGGRRVYLCTSKVGRVPRRYRGRDILEWWADMGVFDATVADLDDPAQQFAAQPQVSGVGPLGHTVSYQQLQRDGAVLLGRLQGVAGRVLHTDNALRAHVEFADQKSAEFRRGVDQYIEKHGIEAPHEHDDPADEPATADVWDAGRAEVDLAAAGITTVVWCTGFTADFRWLRIPVVDDAGMPAHESGVAPVPGVYFVGFPWLRSRKSGIILGMDADARFVSEHLTRYVSSP